MKLAKCLEQIESLEDWDLRFYEEQHRMRPFDHTVTDNLGRIYKAWLKGGPNVEGNEEYIFGIMFSDINGRTFLIDDSEYMTFGELMETIKAFNIK